jgi:hypothetical protein
VPRPRLRPPTPDDVGFIYDLAARVDLRWPTATRFLTAVTPAAVLAQLQQSAEVGYIVCDASGRSRGIVGFTDPDVGSRVMSLDGMAHPEDVDGWDLVRAAVPQVMDEASRAGTIRFVYRDEYLELKMSLISGAGSEGSELWEPEVTIPNYVNIDGLWCTRVTCRLDLTKWYSRI